MSEPPTAGRLLQLLAMLQSRREWPGTVLSERLGVSARTIRRDVERLRELGYPIDSTSGPAGGYRLRAGTAMPPLLLDDQEAVAVAIALSTAARSAVAGIEEPALRALVKLEQVLPAGLRRRVRSLSAVDDGSTAPGGPSIEAETLTLLALCLRERELARFAYTGRDGERSRRLVEPHALVTLGRRWYLLAFDPDRGGWRTFRLDRIASPRAAGRRFLERTIPGGDPVAYVQGRISGVVYRHRALVRFLAPFAELRERPIRGWGELREEPGEDSCLFETSDDDPHWLAVRIVMVGCDFELLDGSRELVEELRRMGERLRTGAEACG